jgi:hypothetical protein
MLLRGVMHDVQEEPALTVLPPYFSNLYEPSSLNLADGEISPKGETLPMLTLFNVTLSFFRDFKK